MNVHSLDRLPPDGRQSEAALAIRRGVCRRLRAEGYCLIPELTLASGRRADLAAVSRSSHPALATGGGRRRRTAVAAVAVYLQTSSRREAASASYHSIGAPAADASQTDGAARRQAPPGDDQQRTMTVRPKRSRA